MKVINLPGILDISHPSCSNHEERVDIKVMDKTSGVSVVTVSVDLKDFARALFGHGNMDCNFIVYPNATNIFGKLYESKEVLVHRDLIEDTTEQQVKDVLASWEIDGWKVSDLKGVMYNNHLIDGDNIKVSLHRYVDPPEPCFK